MGFDPKLHDFIERAKASGAPEPSIVGILTARGWPERDVYEALALHYERLTGIEIPRRAGAATAAKDAFLYLLEFSTLAIWTWGVGSILFTLIDQWFADALFSGNYNQAFETYNIAASMASVLVAFPIYLLVARTTICDRTRHPEKLNSPVRKWLTYMALVIAAAVFIGDLITTVTYLLRGELTSRFLAEVAVVFLLSGGVLFYYLLGLRRTEERAASSRLGLDRSMAVVSALLVVSTVILGFRDIGAPRRQRLLRADQRRIEDLHQLASRLKLRWSSAHNLPQRLDELAGGSLADPLTQRPYDYHPKQASQYELCANFSADSRREARGGNRSTWSHPAGLYCFELNAAFETDNPPPYLPD
ncbi:MAG TPA: DUF5671 domain-containing protein [Candidatus Cybelea sp.]|nr:DUF5671 domain-containing protein [Candidatus Cybelea sp.]